MLKYRHIKKLFGNSISPIVSEDYGTGTEYKIESGSDNYGQYFCITKGDKTHKTVTFYYDDGHIVEHVERI